MGNLYRDKSYLIARKPEEEELGLITVSPLSKKTIQKLYVDFIDDTDFFTSGTNYQIKMQTILDMYSSLCKATGVHIVNKKLFYFAWKWEYKGGKQVIKNINAEIKINNNIIK